MIHYRRSISFHHRRSVSFHHRRSFVGAEMTRSPQYLVGVVDMRGMILLDSTTTRADPSSTNRFHLV